MAAPGDEFIVSVGVFNNAAGATAPIRLEAELSPGLSIQGPASVDLQIPEKKEGVGEFLDAIRPHLDYQWIVSAVNIDARPEEGKLTQIDLPEVVA